MSGIAWIRIFLAICFTVTVLGWHQVFYLLGFRVPNWVIVSFVVVSFSRVFVLAIRNRQ